MSTNTTEFDLIASALKSAELVILDLDDTLIDTSDHFHKFKDSIVRSVAEVSGGDYKDIGFQFDNIDSKNMQIYGHSPERYIVTALMLSASLAHNCFSNKHFSRNIAEASYEFSSTAPRLISGALTFVKELTRQKKVVCVTRGVQRVQHFKLQSHKLDRYLKDIVVLTEKNTSTFAEIVELRKVPLSKVLSIGDSFKHDVKPILQLGGVGIVVRYEHPSYKWDHDRSEVSIGAATVDNIHLLTRLLRMGNDR